MRAEPKRKAIILNGSSAQDDPLSSLQAALIEELNRQGWEVEAIVLRDLNLGYCTGCFECWIKTPGMCKLDDDGPDLARSMISSDLMIFLTPVTFGGYSSDMKRGLDRIICLVSPFFTRIDGEVHHKPRYDSYPALIGLGWLAEADEEEERIFNQLVDRNAINAHSPTRASRVVRGDEDAETVQTILRELLAEIGRAA